jgi:hypothetical protein
MCSLCPAGTSERGAAGDTFCRESTGIVVVTPGTLEVQMKVELPYTKDSFDADTQTRFLSAVASSVETHVGNLYIRSVVEKTSSRRVLRKLLAVSVEVDFAIRVPDAAAQAAMIANEGLTAGRLNAELAKQVSPFLLSWHVGLCVRSACFQCAVWARVSSMHACACSVSVPPSNRADCACSAPFCVQQGLAAALVLTQPAAPAAPAPPAFSAARRAGPARGLQLSVAIIAALPLRIAARPLCR